jgi:hypothetical protein
MTDTQADKLIAEVRKIAGDKPIRWIHQHPRASRSHGRQCESGGGG